MGSGICLRIGDLIYWISVNFRFRAASGLSYSGNKEGEKKKGAGVPDQQRPVIDSRRMEENDSLIVGGEVRKLLFLERRGIFLFVSGNASIVPVVFL